MKSFKIENNIKNLKWVNKNLDAQDFHIVGNEIIIFFYNDMQRNDILNAMMVNSLA
jgi:hypothetical protein